MMETSHMKGSSHGDDFASFADDDEWVEATPVAAVGNREGGANWAAFGSSGAEDDTEWQSFSQPAGTSVNMGSQHHVTQSAPIEASHEATRRGGGSGSTYTQSASLLKECFHTNHTIQATESAQVPMLTVDESLWSQLASEASEAYHPPSCRVVSSMLHDTLFPEGQKRLSELSLFDCQPIGSEIFEWNIVESPTESFDLSPGVFRPRVDIPTDMEIDREKAVQALRGLHIDDLELMHEDLAAKCKRDFEELIAQLEERDALVQEAEIKNKFVAAHLKVHNMRHSYEQAIKHRGKTKDDHVTAAKFLRSIVPYHPPENHMWRSETLQQLTALLDAIAEDSTQVPQLLSDYLQSEVLSSTTTTVRHESPTKANSLSSLSLT